jgi:hypothetical protein
METRIADEIENASSQLSSGDHGSVSAVVAMVAWHLIMLLMLAA